jgi:hypothetical protein
MRVTIVTENNQVKVDDGQMRYVDVSALPDDVHAIQWYDTFGEIEYKSYFVDAPVLDPHGFEPTGETVKVPHRKINEVITDFGPYQKYVDAWYVEDAKRTAEEQALKDQMEADKAKAEAAEAKAKSQRDAFNKIPAHERQHLIDEIIEPRAEAERLAEIERRQTWNRMSLAERQVIIDAAKGI